MRPSAIARRYAEAAFDVARQDGDTSRWRQDLAAAARALQDQEVTEFFRRPDHSREEKMQALERIFGNSQPHVLNLLRILVLRHRLTLVPAILAAFEALEREEQGLVEARVTVARPLGDEEKSAIAGQLGRLTGKRVEIHSEVDPSILGGIVVRVGDKLIDASVAGRLQRLRQQMAV